MTELHPIAVAWRERGRFVRAAGMDVFVVDPAPEAGAEANVVLHGFPSSSSDWRLVLPELVAVRRTVLLDFPGYGLSAKPEEYSYSLIEQCDVLLVVLRELGVGRAHVVAHDMGTSVACELVARRGHGLLPSLDLASLTLSNGSVHIELARLTLSQKVLLSPAAPLLVRFGSKRVFDRQLRRILRRPVDAAELDAMWSQLVHLGGRRLLPKLIHYVYERRRYQHRWIGALRRLEDVPVLILWGTEDPVAVIAIGETLAGEIPRARLVRLPGLGHYPMVEAPAEYAAPLRSFLQTA